ncbi:hypothetical protein AX15_002082 [Amanita polypyramis BW_CC]|nr:hypothetical protein AX15_002082 [Amanita polypyramis BW_CC]
MTLWNFWKSVREDLREVSEQDSRRLRLVPPLLIAFVQDGAIHYFTLVVVLIVVLVLTVVVQGPLGLSVAPWTIAMYSFSTTRLILNLRVFAAHRQGSTPTWHQTFSVRVPFITTTTTQDCEIMGDDQPRTQDEDAELQHELQLLR